VNEDRDDARVALAMWSSRPRSRLLRDELKACPRCGNRVLTEILFGLPNGTALLREQTERGRVALGGCIVTHDDPTRCCSNCGAMIWPDGRTMSKTEWRDASRNIPEQPLRREMSGEWEQYKDRYAAERPETYEAYVDVWNRIPAARREFTGWAIFTQTANAEPKQWRDHPDRVRIAERIMYQGGYELGPPTRRNARSWIKRQS
jgi:hypothetical protein